MIANTQPRITLRPWLASDYHDFAALNADPEVMAYFPRCLNREESDAMADLICEEITTRGFGFWVVALKDSNQFIGITGLHAVKPTLSFAPAIEIGWRLAKAYWGKGYATEAAHLALSCAFDELQLTNVVSFTSCINHPSEAVMKKLGMHKQPDHFYHPDLPSSHPLCEHVLYRISQQQWQQNR